MGHMDEVREDLPGVNPVLQKRRKEDGRKGPLTRRIEEEREKKRKRETTLPMDLEQKAAENKQVTEVQKRVNIEMRRQIRMKEAKEKATKAIKDSPLGLTAAIERQIKEETGMTVEEIIGKKGESIKAKPQF